MRILQTFVLPDNVVKKHNLSFAAANFSRHLLNGVYFDKVYSLIPVNVRGQLGDINDLRYEVVYSHLRLKRGFMAKFAIIVEQWKVFKCLRHNDSIWFYNLNAINVLLFLLLKIFKPSVKLNVIVLDFTPAKSWREQNYWYLKCINAADGRISLSHSPLFKSHNTQVLPGIVPTEEMPHPDISTINKSFLLSGVICNNISLTSKVLDAFSKLSECTLYITGRVLEDEELIRSYSIRYPNIKYLGPVSYDHYVDLLHKVTFLLSTRDPKSPENECNFPSKIIEGLLHNRIIVSTIIYPQLKGLNILKISADNIFSSISAILDSPVEQLLKYANQQQQVMATFNARVWENCICNIERNIFQNEK